MTQLILERFLQHQRLRVVEARDPWSGVYNLGSMGTLFDSLAGDEMQWQREVVEDGFTVKTCLNWDRTFCGPSSDVGTSIKQGDDSPAGETGSPSAILSGS